MNSKQRVMDALNFKNGKVPFDIGAAPTSGIHVKPLAALRDYYNLDKRPITVVEPLQMLGLVEDDLKEVMGIDTDMLWNPNTLFGNFNDQFKEWKTPWGQVVLISEDFTYEEKNGQVNVYASGDRSYPPSAMMPEGGYFFDAKVRDSGFDETHIVLEDNLEEFNPIDDRTLGYLEREMQKVDKTKAVLGNFGSTGIGDIALVPGTFLKHPKGLRDITEWYISTITRQDLLHEIFDYQVTIALKNLKKVWDTVGDRVQVAYICGNDFGTQNAPFCSTETFNHLYMPHYKKINTWVHENTTWKTFKHSCGSIEPLIPSMIEAGFDILNPVQWSAKNMDRKQLKESYGKDIVFWGGGVNTQKTLRFGRATEVEKEAIESCEIFSKDGGYVFNSIHNITADVPIENIAALATGIKRFNGEL